MSLTITDIRWISDGAPRVTALLREMRLQDVFVTERALLTFNRGQLVVEVPFSEWLLALSGLMRRARTDRNASVDELLLIAGERFVARSERGDIHVHAYDRTGEAVELIATIDQWAVIHLALKSFLLREARRLLPPGAALIGDKEF